jgi:hypothetical protein
MDQSCECPCCGSQQAWWRHNGFGWIWQCSDCENEGTEGKEDRIFDHCNVCGIPLRTRFEDGMGMCERCADE